MNYFSDAFTILFDFYFSLPELLQLDLILEVFVFICFPVVRSLWRILSNLEVSDNA